MKYTFQLPEFPESDFELRFVSAMLKPRLYMDGEALAQSSETGKPFLIPVAGGEVTKAYFKQQLHKNPVLEVGHNAYPIGKQLQWYDYVLGALPVLLLFAGGAIGGAIGLSAAMVNLMILRQDENRLSKYLKVTGIVAAAALLYVLAAALIGFITNR